MTGARNRRWKGNTFCRGKESYGTEFIGEVPLNFERLLHNDINNNMLL